MLDLIKPNGPTSLPYKLYLLDAIHWLISFVKNAIKKTKETLNQNELQNAKQEKMIAIEIGPRPSFTDIRVNHLFR